MKKTFLSQTRFFSTLIHILIWSAFIFIPLLFMENAEGRQRFMIFGWSMMFLMAGYFYFNYLFLIPRFLLQKKLTNYEIFMITGFLIISSLNIIYSVIVHAYFIPNIHHHGPLHYAFM